MASHTLPPDTSSWRTRAKFVDPFTHQVRFYDAKVAAELRDPVVNVSRRDESRVRNRRTLDKPGTSVRPEDAKQANSTESHTRQPPPHSERATQTGSKRHSRPEHDTMRGTYRPYTPPQPLSQKGQHDVRLKTPHPFPVRRSTLPIILIANLVQSLLISSTIRSLRYTVPCTTDPSRPSSPSSSSHSLSRLSLG
ncbi:hypothetical protein BC629DRAFT_1599725 [Irpex lacteus]|nr:hypothetical protein BC629DRAFT_1599725 [Irpex lacteus]